MKPLVHDSILTILVAYLNKFARDIYLPAFPVLVGVFLTRQETMQFSLAVFFYAVFAGRLFWPILLERYSFKTILNYNCGLFVFATIVGLFYVDITLFMVVRFIQGFTLGALPTIFRGYVFHRHHTVKTIQVLSYTSFFTVWSPAFAVIVGGFLLHWLGWQAISYGLLVLTVVSWLYMIVIIEAPAQQSESEQKTKILSEVLKIFAQRKFMRYSIPLSFLTAGLASYLTIAPFLFLHHMGLTTHMFSIISFVVFSGMLVGKVLAGMMIGRYSSELIMKLGLLIALAGVLGLSLSSHSLVMIVAMIAVFMAGYGMLLPISKTQVMADSNGLVYSSTALTGVLAGLFSALASSVIAYFAWSEIWQLIFCLGSVSIISIVIFAVLSSK